MAPKASKADKSVIDAGQQSGIDPKTPRSSRSRNPQLQLRPSGTGSSGSGPSGAAISKSLTPDRRQTEKLTAALSSAKAQDALPTAGSHSSSQPKAEEDIVMPEASAAQHQVQDTAEPGPTTLTSAETYASEKGPVSHQYEGANSLNPVDSTDSASLAAPETGISNKVTFSASDAASRPPSASPTSASNNSGNTESRAPDSAQLAIQSSDAVQLHVGLAQDTADAIEPESNSQPPPPASATGVPDASMPAEQPIPTVEQTTEPTQTIDPETEYLWRSIQAYLRTRIGPRPVPKCIFCDDEIMVEGLELLSDDYEPLAILECDHIVGERCMRQWQSHSSHGNPPCPLCRDQRGVRFWRELSESVRSNSPPRQLEGGGAGHEDANHKQDAMLWGITRAEALERLYAARDRLYPSSDRETLLNVVNRVALYGRFPVPPSGTSISPWKVIHVAIARYLRLRGEISNETVDSLLRNMVNVIVSQEHRTASITIWNMSDDDLIHLVETQLAQRRPSAQQEHLNDQRIPDNRSDISMEEAGALVQNNQPQNAQTGSTLGQRCIEIVDPETCNENGFEKCHALVIGALQMRGRMIIQLPSRNPQFSDCVRYYTVRTVAYNIRWGGLPMKARKRDVGRLKRLKKDGLSTPELIAFSSSPCYVEQPQANPIIHLLIRLPEGNDPLPPDAPGWHNEWHSRSDVESVWDSYTDPMQQYRAKSGQRDPKSPWPADKEPSGF